MTKTKHINQTKQLQELKQQNINKNNDEINREGRWKLMLELIEELEINKLESQNTNYRPNLIDKGFNYRKRTA